MGPEGKCPPPAPSWFSVKKEGKGFFNFLRKEKHTQNPPPPSLFLGSLLPSFSSSIWSYSPNSIGNMRRVCSPFLSNLSKSLPIVKSIAGMLSPSFFSPTRPFHSSPPSIPNSTLFLHSPFLPPSMTVGYLSRNMTTALEKPLPLSQQQLELEERFESATTTEEILTTFEALESSFGEGDEIKLGLACLKVGQHLDSIGFEDREKTLSFAHRALKILEGDGDRSVMAAMALHLMGSVCYGMERFGDSLGYLNKANRILGRIEEEDSQDFDVKPVIHAVQLQLANTKTAMGRREDAVINLRKCVELKESIFGLGSGEVGVAYRDLAEAYVAVLNFKEALSLCWKALDIHMDKLGQNSVEVAHDRRILAVIYTGLEEHQKALEQNQLSQKVMRNWGFDSDLLNAEIEAANMLIALGKYDEAVSTLKGVVQQTDKDSHTRALVFMSMAKALSVKENFTDAKRCLEISRDILEKKEPTSPAEAAKGYADMAEMYETMSEFETAISLLKRAILLFEKLPQEQYAEANASARIGWLLLLTGKLEEGIPYLENAAERLKESFGSNHYAVGYIYNNLGAAYLELDRPQSAAQMFALAKDIMDVSLGSHHADSIGACQNLANAYDAVGNYDLALEFQQHVIDAWKGHGPSAKDKLEEAKHHLLKLNRKLANQVLDVWDGEELKTNNDHGEANEHLEDKVEQTPHSSSSC